MEEHGFLLPNRTKKRMSVRKTLTLFEFFLWTTKASKKQNFTEGVDYHFITNGWINAETFLRKSFSDFILQMKRKSFIEYHSSVKSETGAFYDMERDWNESLEGKGSVAALGELIAWIVGVAIEIY